jgi:hypothetical protein
MLPTMTRELAMARNAGALRHPYQMPSASASGAALAAARRLATARGRSFRLELDNLLEALAHPAATGGLDSSLLLDAEEAVGGHFASESSAVLAHEIVWGEDDQAFADWAIRARERWAQAALGFAKMELAAFGAGSPVLPRLLASAMASLGEAIKWRAIAGRGARDLQALHEAYRMAEAASVAQAPATVTVDGGPFEATPEALYLRALLFEALCIGALSRPEMEIADGWLLLWCKDFRVLAEPTAGHCPVAIGIHGSGGLEPCGRTPGAATRYVGGLEGLRGHIDGIRSAFHAGRLVSGTRFAASLPVEHHVSALGRLEELLAFWANPAAAREKRARSADGNGIPLLVGLGEILARGFGPAVDDAAAPDPGAPAQLDARGSTRGDRSQSYGLVLEPLGKRCTVIDRSARGMGVSIPRSGDVEVSTGDLLGVREGDRIRVGRVVRAFADPATGRVRIGIRVLVDDPARVALFADTPGMPRALARVDALFVPGGDPGGQLDALLVSRATFEARGSFEMTLGPYTYTIRFSRDQVSGRGWVAARFEVLDARAC